MRILVIESCVMEGAAWLEGWEGEAPDEVAGELVQAKKAVWVWVEDKNRQDAKDAKIFSGVEKAVGKRERG